MSSGDRIQGAFIGLAIGDAAGWPAARHRSALLAPWSRRLERELDAFAEEHRVTTLPVPFTLNQPVEPLAIGPSDDAEWLAWTALTIHQDRAEAFGGLAGRTDLRVRISVRAALDNLAAGKAPPASGHDNPHHFDDAAAIRAVAFGAAAGNAAADGPCAAVPAGRRRAAVPADGPHAAVPADGRRAAVPADGAAATAEAGLRAVVRADASVTNAGDGVHAALAMAVAIAVLVAGGTMAAAVEAALAELPEDTAIGHASRTALVVARRAGDPFAAVPALDAALLDHVYSYGVAAAHTVPVALALAEVSGGSLSAAVPAAACLPSLADSAPALTGALTGAFTGYRALPEGWRAAARTLTGCGLPELAGTDLIDIAGGLA
ncbi:ADP-ribosylglycohydrolase family protein [Sphaerisporangium perillae]|uniref:ADP-ribosylglycohydrolase family protein n=1 Tax=Sphaerisporangium perillae TaxID=2935860 RepID=UPI00200D8898|nr:ADP-ribosylglycohydrolase family protein [Sphaerisporangium perillae]